MSDKQRPAQPKHSETDEAAAEKYVLEWVNLNGRGGLDIKEAVIFGCQHKESQMRGEIESLHERATDLFHERNQIITDHSREIAELKAKHAEDYRTWSENTLQWDKEHADLRAEIDCLTVERDGAEKRGLMILESKNKIIDELKAEREQFRIRNEEQARTIKDMRSKHTEEIAEIWAKCPNEEWECTKIQRRLEKERDALQAKVAELEGKIGKAKSFAKWCVDYSKPEVGHLYKPNTYLVFNEASKTLALLESESAGKTEAGGK